MEIINKNQDIEKVEELGEERLKKLIGRETKAKNFLNYLKAQLQIVKAKKISMSNVELVLTWEDLIRRFEDYEFKKIKSRVNLANWKGKDRIKIIEKPDSFEVITHQKQSQDEEPQEIKREISKEEVNNVILALNRAVGKENEETGQIYYETPEIALYYSKISNLTHNKEGNRLFYDDGRFEWQHFFGCRFLHTQLNLILRLLDFYQVIHYRGGKSMILKKDFKFQTILKTKVNNKENE